MEQIEYISPEVLIISLEAMKMLTQSGYGNPGSGGGIIGEEEIPWW